ncbi:MAG: hypothetical protein MI741_18175 [Rhodospirillales bacterium]|nr:hypothetical protein [Rhodospirillales bacterium]
MAGKQYPITNGNRWSSYSFIAFCILFAVFLANVLLGKAGVLFDWNLPFLLNDVGEYLVLLFAALSFTVATLIREHRQGKGDAGTDSET